jgi:hypothetical protein
LSSLVCWFVQKSDFEMQDTLMVTYLANLTRSLADRLHNVI